MKLYHIQSVIYLFNAAVIMLVCSFGSGRQVNHHDWLPREKKKRGAAEIIDWNPIVSITAY